GDGVSSRGIAGRARAARPHRATVSQENVMAARSNWFTLVLVAAGAAAVGVVATLAATGQLIRPKQATTATSNPAAGDRKQLYTCGMHPQVVQDHPGNCPICHMKLTPMRGGAAGPRVTIDPTIVQNMGVRTAEVKRG